MRADRTGERGEPREGPVRYRERPARDRDEPVRERERPEREKPVRERARPVREREGPLGDRDEPVRERERPPPRRGGITASEAARLAADYVEEMTGKEFEGITSLEHDDGLWRVGVEVVELRRVPNTTDILALYEAELDQEGELIAYRRTQRYARSQVLEE
jgi:hypothetical protein